MSSLARSSHVGAVVLAATVGLAAMAVSATPAHADAWIQFGIVAPSLPPPPVVVAPSPPPPPVYGYAYSYPYPYPYAYSYSYPYPYYAVPSYGYGRFYRHHRGDWRHHYVRDRDDDDD